MRLLCNRCGAGLPQTHYEVGAGAGPPLCGACMAREVVSPAEVEGLVWNGRREGDAYQVVLDPPKQGHLGIKLGLGMCAFMLVWHLLAGQSRMWMLVVPFDILAVFILVRGVLTLTERIHLRLDPREVAIVSRPLAFWRARRVPTAEVEGFVVTTLRPVIDMGSSASSAAGSSGTGADGAPRPRGQATAGHRLDLALGTGERVGLAVYFMDLQAAERVRDSLNGELDACRRQGTGAPFR